MTAGALSERLEVGTGFQNYFVELGEKPINILPFPYGMQSVVRIDRTLERIVVAGAVSIVLGALAILEGRRNRS